jgi:hypothetical protein
MKREPARLAPPTPAAIRTARLGAGLSQEGAARLISTAVTSPYRTWQSYEAAADTPAHRAMPRPSWELFLLLTDQHPTFRLNARKART